MEGMVVKSHLKLRQMLRRFQSRRERSQEARRTGPALAPNTWEHIFFFFFFFGPIVSLLNGDTRLDLSPKEQRPERSEAKKTKL